MKIKMLINRTKNINKIRNKKMYTSKNRKKKKINSS